MQLVDPPFIATWRANLALDYQRRGERTVLAARRHDGPLVVQKALYPEGDAVCHSIIVHPPAGIVGGDSLEIDARIGAQGHALLTTPGAAKWYRSAGSWAQQRNAFVVDEDACLEWLPQETIVFDGALAQLETSVQLGKRARYIGWEVLCLGRAGSGERFERGQCVSRVSMLRDGKPIWLERGGIAAGGLLMRSAAGLFGKTVCGTLLAVAENVDTVALGECRAITAKSGDTAVTRLPGVMVARYLGDSSEAAKQYFAA
ncbi:MAG TPA: urease accessory protein UreD, partial [Burkholderiales bacterium]|nr:urease accessory protein UreD [Burkholderiales bacterium]